MPVNRLLDFRDALQFKGELDASTSPNYPAADAGHVYRISVSGKVGGASGRDVEAGTAIMCTVDGSAEGDETTVGANWIPLAGGGADFTSAAQQTTRANLEDISDPVNTGDKRIGKPLFMTDEYRIVFPTGTAAGDDWMPANGAVGFDEITPT